MVGLTDYVAAMAGADTEKHRQWKIDGWFDSISGGLTEVEQVRWLVWFKVGVSCLVGVGSDGWIETSQSGMAQLVLLSDALIGRQMFGSMVGFVYLR